MPGQLLCVERVDRRRIAPRAFSSCIGWVLLLAMVVVAACSAPRDATRPRVALVIDDFGYASPEIIDGFIALGVPITVAVLPYQEHSRLAADRAHAAGHQVMLHLPMEGRPGSDPGPEALLASLDEGAVRHRVRRALEAVPHVAGANNHMGSAFTVDTTRMRWVMEELAARRLYFVDSRTAPGSAGESVARALKVRTAARDIFLDNDTSRAAIDRQWQALLGRARATGSAIGIGHVYPETLAALRELLPAARREVDFVFAGALAR